MSGDYDKYYQTENLFGKPYPELLDFFNGQPNRGAVLDLGCGQGRDAIPIARLGFKVTAIDDSKVGIAQLNQVAENEGLTLKGVVADIFTLEDYAEFEFVLLDSMFHFAKKDKQKEIDFISSILSKVKNGCIVVFCIQDSGKKVEILNHTIDQNKSFVRIDNQKFDYTFEDQATHHKSVTNYCMIVIQKQIN